VYFTRATGNTRRLQKGTVWFTFRTSRALQLQGGTLGGDATIAGSDTFPFVISRRLHCYGALVDVGTDGKALPSGGHALPGDAVAVSIGKHGSLYRHRLVVGKMRADSARGAKLGCGADPASRAELFNLTEEPEFEPDRYFFSANAGPYVKDIKWSGWGRDTAEGKGTFINDCASCGAKEITPARLILKHLVACPTVGGLVYRVGYMLREHAGHTKRTDIVTGYPCT
jgi:hypothetical protein